jgi:uncharacterized repeat protein (TIGR01451 family)
MNRSYAVSHRVSGHSGRPRMAVRAALLLSTLSLVAGPLAPLASAATSGGLTVTTPFPSVVAEPGTTATFKLTISVQTEGDVKLAVDNTPEGWTSRFSGGGLDIESAFVDRGKPVEVDLDVDIPETATDDVNGLRVTATQGGDSVTLPLQVRIAAKAGGDVTLTSDFPELRGPQSTDFTFNLTLKNGTGIDQTFALDAQGPDPSWTVSAKPAGQSQAVSTVVKAGSTASVTATAQAPDGTAAGTYPFVVTATGGGKTAQVELSIVITGTFTVDVSTPDQVLSTSANAGSPTDFTIRVTNNGTAPITNVTTTASTAPTGWTVTFEPATVPSIDAGQFKDVVARITPTSDAITGDYNVVMTAKATEASGNTTIRVKVETPAFWWIAGLLLIVAVFAGLYWVFRTYGRR